MPCGPHSLIEYAKTHYVPMFALHLYSLLNYKSGWDQGISHKLSLRDLAKLTGVYKKNKKGKWTGKSRVANAIKWLCDNGWLIRKNNANGQPNNYQIVHHNCAPEDVPLDDDGRPKKCATPHGEGSAFEKMFNGEISWQACLFHTVAKVMSDWASGNVRITIKQARNWLRFSAQKICDIRNSLIEHGLLEEIGHRYRGFTAKILPLPYAKRRRRREWKEAKGMRCDDEFYYSYNELWRISRKTGDFQAKEEGIGGGWRFSNEYELERINPKIHRDFMKLRVVLLQIARHLGSRVSQQPT